MGVTQDDYESVYLVLLQLYGFDYHTARRQPVRYVHKVLDMVRKRQEAQAAAAKDRDKAQLVERMKFQNMQTLVQMGMKVS